MIDIYAVKNVVIRPHYNPPSVAAVKIYNNNLVIFYAYDYYDFNCTVVEAIMTLPRWNGFRVTKRFFELSESHNGKYANQYKYMLEST
jgi:hypothetical protein